MFRGEHINILARLTLGQTSRLSQGYLDVNQSKKFMFMCLFSPGSRFLKKMLRGEFRGILGAALGIQTLILGMRTSILGMASHDLSNTKATILGATPRAIPGIGGNPHGICPCILGAFLPKIGVVPALQIPRVCKRWFPNGGSSSVGERNSATPLSPRFNPLFTSILPHFNLFLT